MAAVGNHIGDHDMMLGVDRGLNVVADDIAMIAAGCHSACIWINQQDLPVRRGFQLPGDLLKFPEAPTQRRQALRQVIDPGGRRAFLGTLGFLKLGKIARDALFDMGLPARKPALGVVLSCVFTNSSRLLVTIHLGDFALVRDQNYLASTEEAVAQIPEVLLCSNLHLNFVRQQLALSGHFSDAANEIELVVSS